VTDEWKENEKQPATPISRGLIALEETAVHETMPFPGNPVEVDDKNWEKYVEKAEHPVAVMFYSPVCPYCHQIEPYFRNYALEYQKTIIFVRLNVLSSPWTSERYGVRSTPTFKFFCSGKPVQEIVGAVYPAILKKLIEEVLLHGKECAANSSTIDYEIAGYG
jgi:thioredoxin 1